MHLQLTKYDTQKKNFKLHFKNFISHGYLNDNNILRFFYGSMANVELFRFHSSVQFNLY
jgi:hypothetical protein